MNISQRIIALLPFKLNSSRVPGKNFKDFDGKPLYYWIINTLCQLDFVKEIVIDTDAIEELSESKYLNDKRIIIKKRKSELQGDLISMNKIIADDISDFGDEIFLMTHTTSPLIRSETLLSAYLQFQDQRLKQESDSLFSVNTFYSRFFEANFKPINHNLDKLIPTQDLKPIYEENSAFYFFTKESFLKTNSRIGESPYLFPIPRLESIDIDDLETWEIALKLKKQLDVYGI